jgi:mRNA-degrading endonuclease RelE of RelBE toxin-antitoxin system
MRRRWTVYVNANALRAIYGIGRGVVATITDTIDGLSLNPIPDNAIAIHGLQNTYELKAVGYIISYQLNGESQTIRVLSVDAMID